MVDRGQKQDLLGDKEQIGQAGALGFCEQTLIGEKAWESSFGSDYECP